MKKFLLGLILLINFLAISQTGTDCSTSILVSSTGCSAVGEYTNAGIAGTISPTCFGAGTNNSMWFRFVASSPTVIATVNGTTMTSSMVSLLSPVTAPCTGPFTGLGCNAPGTATSTLTYSALTVGNTYYVVVDGANNITGTFQLCLSSPATPSNDNPCSPINLPASNFCSPAGAYTNTGATGEALTNTSVPSCFAAANTMNSVYFSFVALGTNNTVTVTGSSTSLNRPQVAIISPTAGCGGTTFTGNGCASAATGVNAVTLNVNNLVAGNTYYILVDGFAANTGAFSICVNSYVPTSTVVNDQCSGATPLCPNQNYISTTVGATSTNDIAVSLWSCNVVVDNAVWFSFVTTNPVQAVSFNVNTVCTADFLQFEVFRKTGTGTVCETTGWTSQGCMSLGPVDSQTLTIAAATLVANTTYYIVCDNWPNSNCNFNFTITGNQGTNAGADQQVCLAAAPFNMAGFTPTGGTWSGPGITNATLGTFNPATAGVGVHTLYYSQGACVDAKVVTVTAPVVTVSNDITICAGQSTTLSGNVVSSVTNYPVTVANSTASAIPNNGVTDGGAGWSGASGIFLASTITPTTLNTGWSFSSISLNITHTNNADLIVYLTNPCGLKIRLIRSNGGTGDNFTNTSFSQSASSLLSAGVAPFTGNYIPQAGAAAWAAFLACTTGNGAWTLSIGDKSLTNIGTLQNWNLVFNNPVPVPTYVWSPTTNMAISTTLSPIVTPTATTTYTLTGTDFFGCVNTDLVIVTVNPLPTVSVTNATTCAGTAATITATGVAASGTYLWNTGATTPSITMSPAVTTPYTVVYTLNGCSSLVGTGTITITPIPTLSVNSLSTCPVSPATMVATPSTAGGTFLWDTGATSSSITVTPGVTTTYSCVYTLAGCESLSASGTLSMGGGAPINAGVDAIVCLGQSITLTAAGGLTYIWDNGLGAGASFSVSPVVTTTYSVTGTDVSGCVGTDAVTITVNPVPTVIVTNTAVCAGIAGTITATGAAAGGTYLWSTGGITPSITMSPGVTTPYTVVYTVSGCSSLAGTGTITVNPIPTITVNSPSICVGGIAVVTATPSVSGGTYLWATGQTTPSISVMPGVSTTYSCVYTLAGCSSTSVSGVVTVLTSAPINAGLDIVVCENTPVTLTGTGGVTYVWDNGVSNGVAFTPAVGSITYTVTGTNINGCVDTDLAIVTVNPLPVIGADIDQTVCIGSSVTLAGSGGVSYTWNNGVSNGVSFVPALGTLTYTVTGTDINGCVNTDQVVVTVLNNAPINAGLDVVVCENTSVTLTGTGGVTYVWNNGVSNGVAFTPALGTITYTVNGVDANGCLGSDQVVVIVNPLPVIGAGIDQTVCFGTSITLSGSNANTYVWSPVITNGVSFIPNVGTINYTVTGTAINGCVDTDEVLVVVNPLPIADFITSPTVLNTLELTSTMVNTSIGAQSYNWIFMDGGVSTAVNPVHTFPEDVYVDQMITLIATSQEGCVDTVSSSISIIEESLFYVPNAFTPDGNDFNETFKAVFTSGYDPQDFELLIYNRWGELIFESHDVSRGWNGTYGVDGDKVQDGTYAWKINFKLKGLDKHQIEIGHVNVFR